MQYTATTHANPVRVTFEPLYRPSVHIERASDDPAGRSGPVHYRFRVTPIFDRYLYRPVIGIVRALAAAGAPDPERRREPVPAVRVRRGAGRLRRLREVNAGQVGVSRFRFAAP